MPIRLFACLLLLLVGLVKNQGATVPYPDRFVWVFGWNLGKDSDVTEITQLLNTAARHGFNGAVMSLGLDTLCQKTPEYFRRLQELNNACQQLKIEFIPAIFSVGYGGAALSHDRNLAEGLAVSDAPFAVSGPVRMAKPSTPRGAIMLH